MQEAQNIYGDTPLIKYDPIVLEKVFKKPRYTKIDEKIVRFKSNEKNNSPSPSSYDTQKAMVKSQWIKREQPLWGNSPKKSYFDDLAKRNITPGPAVISTEKFLKLSSSPLKSKRH